MGLLTNCKVQIKMSVHRPLQQPIVSAVKTWLWAGGKGTWKRVGRALNVPTRLSPDPRTAVPFSSGAPASLCWAKTRGWVCLFASAPAALEVTGWVVASRCVKGGGCGGGRGGGEGRVGGGLVNRGGRTRIFGAQTGFWKLCGSRESARLLILFFSFF